MQTRMVVLIATALTVWAPGCAGPAAAGGIRLRDCAGWKRLPALDFAFPLIPGVFILASLWMLIYTFWLRPDVLLACAVTLLVGMAVYRFRFRRAENARAQHRNAVIADRMSPERKSAAPRFE